jgi:glucuronate isomerase
MNEDFLLQNKTAKVLYHEYAKKMPIYDYHCHLSAALIAEDKRFSNLTQAWLAGDHYKWRAMRANGIAEKYITGDASDREKFEKWAQTVPYCIRNPLYHWTCLELKKPFGITDKLLDSDTAGEIYEACSEMLKTPQFSARSIMRNWNVKLVCTTEDPTDTLDYHAAIRKSGFEIAIHTAWRPDKAMAADNPKMFNAWTDKLAALTDTDIRDMDSFLAAIRKRQAYFHANGCRVSDHGLEKIYADSYTDAEIKDVFQAVRTGKPVSPQQVEKFKSAMLYELCLMNHEKGWAQQFHLGVLRNNNSKMFAQLGPDAGYDSIGDFNLAAPMNKLFDRLDSRNNLCKTIIYSIHPKDNEVLATMIGNFQDGASPGKMQLGSGWWFLDQMDGMIKQVNALSNMGLLSRFVGMLTDSRSFLSYSRHEYFRRILCNLLGEEVEKGFWPDDKQLLGRMVEDICFNNARNYFAMECK